jgi:hypothetical protein
MASASDDSPTADDGNQATPRDFLTLLMDQQLQEILLP